MSIHFSRFLKWIREKFSASRKFIGMNIKEKLTEYKINSLLFGGQISRSFRSMEEAVKKKNCPTSKVSTYRQYQTSATQLSKDLWRC